MLSSGSGGNSLLVRAGELRVLIDAGLPPREQRARLERAGVPARGLDHVLVTHAHLDHARSAGVLATRHDALLHCPEAMMRNRSVRRAPRLSAVRVGGERDLGCARDGTLVVRSVLLPHDCDPTVAYRMRHGERTLVVLTDMGRPCREAAARLAGAHVLVLEFNHDAGMLEAGPYAAQLKRRVAGDRGHLSNEQAARMLEWLASDALHTLVLAHLSAVNNTPERALEAARATLERLGLGSVEVLVAEQDRAGPNLAV